MRTEITISRFDIRKNIGTFIRNNFGRARRTSFILHQLDTKCIQEVAPQQHWDRQYIICNYENINCTNLISELNIDRHSAVAE